MSNEPGLTARPPSATTGDVDRELTLAFQRGDKGAYQAIYDLHSRRVRGVCGRMLSCPEDAQEASQEVFLRVYQALSRFNGRYQLGPWITRIATNVCLDQIRSKARHPEQLRDDELFDADPSLIADNDDPESRVIRVAETRRIRRVLDSLPPLHRAAIVLRDFEGLSYAEVALALEITEPQAKALIHRARKSFKRSWTEALAAFVMPWRYLTRLRASVADPGQEQTSHVLASGSQIVANCSAALQQCGQYVVDKAAGVVTAIVVGGVAATPMAAAVGATIVDRPAQEAEAGASASTIATTLVKATKRSGKAPEARPDDAKSEPAPTATPASDPTAEPAPTEEPPAETDGEPQGEPAPAESPSLPPEPPGFSLGFSIAMAASSPPCSCLGPTEVIEEYVQADDSGVDYLDQAFTGSAEAAGTATYGLWLHHQSRYLDDHSMEFTLRSEEGVYRYSAAGKLLSMTSTEWGGWLLVYEGTYHLGSRPTSAESVPTDGDYQLEVAVSATSDRVVSTMVSLGETGN